MYMTLKRLVSKSNSMEDLIAWKGFLIGIILAIFIIGPITTLFLTFVFNKHTDIDDMIVAYINSFIKSMANYTL